MNLFEWKEFVRNEAGLTEARITKSQLKPVIKARAAYFDTNGSGRPRIEQRAYDRYMRALDRLMTKLGVQMLSWEIEEYIDKQANELLAKKIMHGPGSSY